MDWSAETSPSWLAAFSSHNHKREGCDVWSDLPKERNVCSICLLKLASSSQQESDSLHTTGALLPRVIVHSLPEAALPNFNDSSMSHCKNNASAFVVVHHFQTVPPKKCFSQILKKSKLELKSPAVHCGGVGGGHNVCMNPGCLELPLQVRVPAEWPLSFPCVSFRPQRGLAGI